ncbi:hypothetical protein SADUNF_Sadunf10G0105500 [Salix dunnii]|uniref:Cytochrome P450 n=1 Tax=Salix dunnii TaxID=1413687 RepID=A0A835MUS4_9ROSI|nr:hypothetical protein SADUNF_Sadunf10G0105500 [Salix dunnii]
MAAFLPFGLRPRTCAGSVTETKIALAMILQQYRFALSPTYICPLTSSPSYDVPTTWNPNHARGLRGNIVIARGPVYDLWPTGDRGLRIELAA